MTAAPPTRAVPGSKITLRLGHSPDPDDAFMWYPLANFAVGAGAERRAYTPRIDTGPFEFVHVLEDIQSLNERSIRGELEITAISIHQYPYVADRYALTSCGSSMGDNYGPMIVAKRGSKLKPEDLSRVRIAIPGERTTAFLALSLLLGQRVPNYKFVMFDQIIQSVASGEFDAGLIIHEGQLTFEKSGLECVVDLGKWWTQTRGLPLPLGGNAIRRDLVNGPAGPDALGRVCRVLLDSIEYALGHRDESVAFALNYARDMGKDLADRFVGMYVNKWTLDYGPTGRNAVNKLLSEAAKLGLVPDVGRVDFIDPA
ncbi:MAG: ABC transporter substrate-binding protein [Planctomycetes bacterium]|nr:ABC transporter substrate-binding protein [Planctomycetota bacterium]